MKRQQITSLLRNKWMPFILISVIYLSLSASVSISRYMNLETVIVNKDSDYYLHTRYTAVVASGVSPYSSREYFYKTSGFIPIEYCYYSGYNTVNAIIMHLTTLGAEEVVYVVAPFLFNIFLVLAIFASSKILRFTPTQSAIFLILYCFVNDSNAIFTPAYAMGEALGNSFGIVGVAYFLKQTPINLKKTWSYVVVLYLLFSVVLHLYNFTFIAILTVYVVFCIILSLVTKKHYQYSYKHLALLGLVVLLFIPFIKPL